MPRGAPGELCTRGYSVMLGYWDDPERTAEAIDATAGCTPATSARSTRTATCNIVGRMKDMVIRGGENIYPREIEEFLYTHPKIEDVQVVGIPDETFGEEACACVRLVAGASADAEGSAPSAGGTSRTIRSRGMCGSSTAFR